MLYKGWIFRVVRLVWIHMRSYSVTRLNDTLKQLLVTIKQDKADSGTLISPEIFRLVLYL